MRSGRREAKEQEKKATYSLGMSTCVSSAKRDWTWKKTRWDMQCHGYRGCLGEGVSGFWLLGKVNSIVADCGSAALCRFDRLAKI